MCCTSTKLPSARNTRNLATVRARETSVLPSKHLGQRHSSFCSEQGFSIRNEGTKGATRVAGGAPASTTCCQQATVFQTMDQAALALLRWSLRRDSERRLPSSIEGCSLLAKSLRSGSLPLPSHGEASHLGGGSKGDTLLTLPGRDDRTPAQARCCTHLMQGWSSQSQMARPLASHKSSEVRL